MLSASKRSTSGTVILTLALLILLLVTGTSFAGHGVGNGGDHIRATFIASGQSVMKYLTESSQGQSIVTERALSLDELRATLTIDVISVSTAPLFDNSGSSVDAIGTPGKIILSQDRWADHFEKERDVYYLVFHEMLRAAGVNDDNYIISEKLSPFPATFKITTRIASIYPIVGQTDLSTVIATDKIVVEGNGCSLIKGDTLVDIDSEKNVISLSMRRFEVPLTATLADRKSCGAVIPFQLPKGKRLVVELVDFSARTILSPGSSAALSLNAHIANQTTPVVKKSYASPTRMRGRLFVRSSAKLSSVCGETNGQLTLRMAASIERKEASQDLDTIMTDSIGVYASVVDCAK